MAHHLAEDRYLEEQGNHPYRSLHDAHLPVQKIEEIVVGQVTLIMKNFDFIF